MTQAAGEPQSPRYSIAHVALLLPWIALVVAAWRPVVDNSFLWHVRAGTLQMSQGGVLTSDPFSFTMLGEPWRTQSWLVELLYGWAEDLTGLGFVPNMVLVVSALTFFGLGIIAYRLSHSVAATGAVLVLSTFALLPFLVPRPVLFSYLLMTLVVVAWERPATRWTLPFLLWLWAGLHASFVIGLAYVGLSLVMRRQWRLLTVVLVSGLATLATAHGVGILSFLREFLGSRESLEYLTEWRRLELTDPLFLPLAGGVVLILVGAFRGRIHLMHLWLIVPFLVLGMTSARTIPPAWLALVPLVSLSLSDFRSESRGSLSRRLVAIYGAVLLGFPFLLSAGSGLSAERFPIDMVASLEDVHTFHDDRVGGFLIWAEGPERKVYVDDRAELFGPRLEELVMVRTGEIDWMPVFERDGIRQALLANTDALISELIDAGWTRTAQDEHFTLLARRGTETR